MNVRPRQTLLLVLAPCIVVAGWLCFHNNWPRGEALGIALQTAIAQGDADKSLVARLIWSNYVETRADASRWSGIYWGFTFTAALFSALAALILKFETLLKNEAAKKDVAAILSVAAALLITVSTSGDFHQKWQANRVAAAQLEQIGYQFLSADGAEPRRYLPAVGRVLLVRSVAIAGADAPKPEPDAAVPADAGR
ncbi:DUF4231 domain-containing protein [Solimonas terrae]|uniref:DUF4231 domain-containing protein n=1 Tax=Solimonas terrae TaxID=1396819 RepID=A0A6M2BVE3_9GAMM|nr:DUF4231 domain-containing protein [Solimonas terrae]NGY06330.1 DUF4231 domain-containing protein [Solimonas terrae]